MKLVKGNFQFFALEGAKLPLNNFPFLCLCSQGRAGRISSECYWLIQNIAEGVYQDSDSGCSSSKKAEFSLQEQGNFSLTSFSTRLLDDQGKSSLVPTQDILYIGGRFCVKLRNAVMVLLEKTCLQGSICKL